MERPPTIMRFVVPHQPMGAPRMTQRDKWKKRPCVVKYREFKDAIRKACGAMPEVSRITSVSWVAWFVPPQSWSKKDKAMAIGQLHRARPDRDNIDKAVLDALFPEDSGIASGTIEKRWGDRAELCVTIIAEAE